jgi:anti-anti-sigma factor
MTIEKLENGVELTLILTGKLDTMTSKQLEDEISLLDGKGNVVLDFAGLEYISSSGLRVLSTGKIMVLYILIFKFFDSIREDGRFWTKW